MGKDLKLFYIIKLVLKKQLFLNNDNNELTPLTCFEQSYYVLIQSWYSKSFSEMCILFWEFFVNFFVISEEMHDNWEGAFWGNKTTTTKNILLLSRRSIFFFFLKVVWKVPIVVQLGDRNT